MPGMIKVVYLCKFCNIEKNSKNSLSNHEIRCKENPERIICGRKHSEQAKRKIGEVAKKRVFSSETRQKLSKLALGRKLSEKHKKILSESAKARGLGGTTQSRWIKYKGKTLGSSYELTVVKDLEKNNIQWETCKRFNYIDNTGKKRTYTPDIYLPEYDLYLDPKNDFLINNLNPRLGFKDIDKIRWVSEQNNIKILVLNKTQLSWEYIKQAR